MEDSKPELLPADAGGPTPTEPVAADPQPQMPPWMAHLGAKITGGPDKLDNVIVLQNSRLDTLDATMMKQATMTKQKMDNLSQSINNEAKVRAEDENATAKTLAAIESRLAVVELRSDNGHATEENHRDEPAAGALQKCSGEGVRIQDSFVLGYRPRTATLEQRGAKAAAWARTCDAPHLEPFAQVRSSIAKIRFESGALLASIAKISAAGSAGSGRQPSCWFASSPPRRRCAATRRRER